MKVLHLYKTYLPETMGGVECVINQLACASMAFGVTPTVMALSSESAKSNIVVDGHTVHRIPKTFEVASTPFSLRALGTFRHLANSADLIHYHFPWPFMDLLHFAARVDRPTVVTYHSDIIRQKALLQLYRPLQHMFLKNVDHIVATSENYFQTSPVLQKFAAKVSVIPIGLDAASYPQTSEKSLAHWRKRFPGKFFLFVGVLRYYKGLHILLEAAKGLDQPIVIVGAGPVEKELREQAQKLGLNNIHFIGRTTESDKIALFELCYGVVFPSHLRSEAFGVSLLEGAMFGKPLISSELGTGTSFINIDGLTGLVVAPGDQKSLREALELLLKDEQMAQRMGCCARERYLELFTAERMAARYVDIYRRLIASTDDADRSTIPA